MEAAGNSLRPRSGEQTMDTIIGRSSASRCDNLFDHRGRAQLRIHRRRTFGPGAVSCDSNDLLAWNCASRRRSRTARWKVENA